MTKENFIKRERRRGRKRGSREREEESSSSSHAHVCVGESKDERKKKACMHASPRDGKNFRHGRRERKGEEEEMERLSSSPLRARARGETDGFKRER